MYKHPNSMIVVLLEAQGCDEIKLIEEQYRNILKLKARNSVSSNEKIASISNHSHMNSSPNNSNSNKHIVENEEISSNDLMNIKFSQSGPHKRHHDFYNNKNSFQHYLKKLKTCRIDSDDLRRTLLEKRIAYDRENQIIKTIQDDEKKGMGMGSESNSSSSNHEGLHLYRKLNFLNKNNRSKSKNKNRKRKRINAKFDKKFILKCRTCKFINPNGFNMGDYYTCQNCGYNDFSVIRSSSPNNGE
ncbi:conserved Plasmodium protein, unknown function [Plasmodium malariae]|uniref:Uncharacterized protein n=2 Tax=Plasmodium malariae TaxID=5858 RepID=A0A1D3PBD2_PLAMA|nr:conserved Plasmodium protein, unknown function [Plasmodium malariae]SCN12291.1 conserved Plasmodium protein, unknown function [Plasmodium malariae]